MGQVTEKAVPKVTGTEPVGHRVPGAFSREASGQKLSPEEWLKEWEALAEEIGKVWPTGVSAVDVVSEMRR